MRVATPRSCTGGINGAMYLLGTVAGDMWMDFTRYVGSNCTQPIVDVHADGTFNDLGPVSEAVRRHERFRLISRSPT